MKTTVIAGCYVTSGLARRGADCRLVRDGTVIYTGKIGSLRRVDDDVRDVAAWVSPNPGGVGPMTRALLLKNVVEMAERAN